MVDRNAFSVADPAIVRDAEFNGYAGPASGGTIAV
jgi:hypothetical protein